ERLPEAPAIGPEHLGTLRTLRQIIEFLSAPAANLSAAGAARAENDPRAAGALDSSAVSTALLAVVSEQTGYPAETLDLDMGLESDLGIDSI
ncbi:MAG TPA: hypothetical protein DCM05_12745, partial [Elusimicrobia bacterium]|nr:hypothetical protein [Elusimicrobiota bacterium]